MQSAQAYDVNQDRRATNFGQKHLQKYSLPNESDQNHVINVESEMHKNIEEIYALLYSDDDGDYNEVTSTGNQKHKLIDGMYKRLPRPVDSASSVNLHEPRECVSDAKSKYSGGQMYFTRKTEEDNSAVGDIQLRKAKIRESLKILENLTPGAKGKHPLLVIDETIDYLKSLMSQTRMLGVKYHYTISNKYE
ncbi:hypothetical protein KIW84_015879 [Lathyrus oleraceus]|uniref:Uncharacterized protein n=1 Tax=Pisum sativum TaxID=3888 RepID=A0A9D5BRX7_PEA|nr:hypothetical protein KIW84_015879 [Pisum sativum]